MPLVKCPNCKGVFYKTTDKFDPNVRCNGKMVELIEPYKSRGWIKFVETDIAQTSSTMYCANCTAMLAPNGKLLLVEVKDNKELVENVIKAKEEAEKTTEDDLLCPYCGKKCVNKGMYTIHTTRQCKERPDAK